MGAEILKTVLVRSLNEILILGAIILLRALLSLMIHFEIKAEQQHGSPEEASPNNYHKIFIKKESRHIRMYSHK